MNIYHICFQTHLVLGYSLNKYGYEGPQQPMFFLSNVLKFCTYFSRRKYCLFNGCYAILNTLATAQQPLNEQYSLLVYCGKNVQNLILSKFCIVYIVEISIFQAVAKEKHWLLGTLITILIQGIAHDEASLDPYLNE